MPRELVYRVTNLIKIREMVTTENGKETLFDTPGKRLVHLLDQIGFQKDRGIITDLHTYLLNTQPDDFSDLSYGTVRAWFAENSPPMKRMSLVIEALRKNYPFDYDIMHIKTWWKVGGFYPFMESSTDQALAELDNEARATFEKTKFVIMSLVTEECGESFEKLSADELKTISDAANQFVQDFTDPYQTTCPNRYIRAVIRDQLGKL
jgi:hypothetical protein